ncbi:DUF6705 family protein [Chryseobacterium sp. RLHN22]|uniref:DUF6705 family protein n=1 Tax=Chryseobacterium sp. RLHN22 TaxID=3437885 RepID=UPI003D9ABDED
MKQILAILLLTMTVNCKAQSPVYTLGSNTPTRIPIDSYIKDSDNLLDKFVGTWKYNQNGKIFTVNLQKSEMKKLATYYVDELNGFFKYIDNNSTIVDTSSYPLSNSKITGAWISVDNPNKVILLFNDPERPKMSSRVTLTYSNINGVEKLHWDLKLTGYVSSRDPNMNQATDFRVPTNVELIKQ